MRRGLEHARRVLFTGSAFLFFFAGGALLAWIVLPLARLRGGTETERHRRARRLLGRAWRLFHGYMRWTGLLAYDPSTVDLALPEGPFVMVANHPTLVDVTALVAATPELVCVSKGVMYRSPLVGRILRECDHVQAGDGSPFSGAAVVAGAVARLRAGTPVLLFPEGTRSPPHGLGEFRHGAFEIAAQAGVPVVPVLVVCEPPTLLRGQRWYQTPEREPTMTISQLPILNPPFGDTRAAARELRALYLTRLGALRGEVLPNEMPGALAR